MSNDPLLQPFQLKHLTLKNRLMITSHEPSYHDDGMPKDRYRLYHVERAKGGVALTMTAGSAIVSADSPPAFGNLHAYKDEIVPWLKKLADECHDYGTAVMIQLTHLGRRGSNYQDDWLPLVSSSQVREPAHRHFPKVMEDWDIERVIGDYASAAERMVAANLDGFELQMYGHLIDNFWTPSTARRTDEYGGSLENRMRFGMRILQEIRKRIGTKPIVGIRIAADEDWEFGLTRNEGIEICKRFQASGLIDFLNIVRGHAEHDSPIVDFIPATGMKSSPHLDFAGEVRAATRFPTFHASRIADVATARHAVASGKLDMVDPKSGRITEYAIDRFAEPYEAWADPQDRIWMSDGGRGGVLIRFDPDTKHFTNYPGIELTDMPKIAITREGAVWYNNRGAATGRRAPAAVGVLFPDVEAMKSFEPYYAIQDGRAVGSGSPRPPH